MANLVRGSFGNEQKFRRICRDWNEEDSTMINFRWS